ncbi:DUF4129 domain-containing protein [Cellulomonas sp. JZ18]|uniref:DUF4129 domain-containing protein n=1 Tax=Cellulomonas sp. JZ18 TaxID=2654191 RepID=UPI0012D3AD24|nr:DUF4129 domain-containing protein [Cellulomonas sp. JZ18]QGQ20655.1 DUF4129 domain-containing protein [Cellulomonas sp. JZ18]
MLAAALAGPVRLTADPVAPLELPTFSAPPQLPPPTAGPDRTVEDAPPPPAWLGDVVGALLTLVAVAALALLARWLLRRRWWVRDGGPRDDDLDGAEGDVDDTHVVAAMRAGVASAARALDDDVPPGDAVVAAWVAVEDAAASTGVVRDRAQTATEFTVDVLDGTRADPVATRALLDLYLAARFSAHAVTAADVVRARELLAAVGDGLARRADDDDRRDDAQGAG